MSKVIIFTNKPSEKNHYRRICFCEDSNTDHDSKNTLLGTVILTCNSTASRDEYREYKMRFKITINDGVSSSGEITFINTDTQINYVMKYKISYESFALEMSKWCESDVPKYRIGEERMIFGEDPFKTMNLVTPEDIKIINFYRDEQTYKPFKLLTPKEQDYIKEQRKRQQSAKITQQHSAPLPPPPSIVSQTQSDYNKQSDMRSYMVDSPW